eukprot:SM001126S24102  [mRNA]  locus=s1126:61:1011:+ [translate_table: standard]
MSFMRGDLLTRMRKLVKAGIREKPAWLDAMEKCAPASPAEFQREAEAGEAAAAREREQAAAEGRPLPPRHRSALEEFQEQEWKVVAQSMHALGTGRRLPS